MAARTVALLALVALVAAAASARAHDGKAVVVRLTHVGTDKKATVDVKLCGKAGTPEGPVELKEGLEFSFTDFEEDCSAGFTVKVGSRTFVTSVLNAPTVLLDRKLMLRDRRGGAKGGRKMELHAHFSHKTHENENENEVETPSTSAASQDEKVTDHSGGENGGDKDTDGHVKHSFCWVCKHVIESMLAKREQRLMCNRYYAMHPSAYVPCHMVHEEWDRRAETIKTWSANGESPLEICKKLDRMDKTRFCE